MMSGSLLANSLFEGFLGQFSGVKTELLLKHLRVLFMVDLVGKLLKRFLDVLVLAFLAKQIDDFLC
jgi:hypothetical protein